MRLRPVLSLITCIAVSGIVAPPAIAAEDNAVVIGRLGSVSLNASEMRRLLSFMGVDARKQLAESDAEMDKVVRGELVRRAVLAEAREKGFDKKSEIQYLMERGREQALLSAYVQSLARPPADFPTEEQLKMSYETNKQILTMPPQYRIARILIVAPSGGDKARLEATGKKAADLAAQLQRSPDDFAKLAKEHSDHKASGAKGGELGWVRENQLVPAIRAEVAKLDKGGVTPAVRTRDGWNIIRMLEKTPSRPRTLEESRTFLTSGLRQRWLQEQEKVYLENLLKKTAPQIDAAELERLQENLAK